jgi:hypothetical protein
MKYVRIVFSLFVVAFGVWLYFSSKQEKLAADNAYKELQGRYADTLMVYRQYKNMADSAISNATATAIQAGEIAKESQIALDQERGRVKRLLSVLDNAEKETPDSTWIPVSPNYKWGCDSLRRANLSLNTMIVQYEQDNQAHVDAMSYEIGIRDSVLKKERSFSEQFRQQLAYCITALGNAEKAKGKTQLYAGMAAWGNSITPLGGGEINLGLKTPRDQFYEIKGAYLGKWWVGVGTKFKLSF